MQRVLFILMLIVGMGTVACTDSAPAKENTSSSDKAVKTADSGSKSSSAKATSSASPTSAEWTNWRGPNYNGAVEASNLPAKFSPTENVKWKV